MDFDSLSGRCGEAARFVTARIASGAYSLGAKSSGGGTCPVDGFGHVLCAWFALRALGEECSAGTTEAIRDRIFSERVHGLWGYGPGQPLDADDTAFAMRSLHALGEPFKWSTLLAFHAPRANLFRTFAGRGPVAMAASQSAAAHRAAHVEVNANVYCLLRQLGASPFINLEAIAACQCAEGNWTGYFYPGAYYATMFCVEALAPDDRFRAAVDRAIEFLLHSQNADGSWGGPGGPYSTALALNGLRYAGQQEPAYARGVQFLLQRQRADGSWSSDEVVYAYRHRDEPPVIWRAFDTNRVLTTSLVLSALRSGALPKGL